MVSNCGSNEFGGITGGKQGDQTKKEYRIRDWYSFGQRYVLRHPNIQIGMQIAQLGRDAANNDHIGYDQNTRMGFYNQLRNVNWNPSAITTNCSADCSSSTCTIVYAVGQLTGDSFCQAISPSLSTGAMLGPYRSAGFIVLTDSKYLNSGDYLLPGDIQLKPGSHTNINLDAGSLSGSDIVISDGGVVVGSGSSIMLPSVYSPRITAPEDTNSLYINSQYSNGQNPCTAIDNKTGSVLPNCVGYCYGRFMEIMNGMRPNLSTGNANRWYNHSDEYQRGSEPRVGAIGCWVNENGAGHLAVVERIYTEGENKGSVLFSTSIYPDQKFVLQLGSPPHYLDWKGYIFKGFIYNPMAATDASQGGDLYEEVNDADDAVLREIGYITGHIPTSIHTGIRLSCINYTTALGAFFKGAILEPGMIISSESTGSVDLSGVDLSSQDSVAKAIFQFFLTKGLNAAAVCGILGNMMQESSMNPAAFTSNPNNTYPMRACGLVQWTDGGRYNIHNATRMIDYVGQNWRNNLSGQLDYLHKQLTENFQSDGVNFRGKVWDPLLTVPNNLSGAYQARAIFQEGFEGYSGEAVARNVFTKMYWDKLAIQV